MTFGSSLSPFGGGFPLELQERYDPSTRTVSGRTIPSTVVTITVDGSEVGTTSSDSNGYWVYRFNNALSAGAQVISHVIVPYKPVLDSAPIVDGPTIIDAGLKIVGNLTRANYTADATSAGNEARESRYPFYFGRQPVTEFWILYCNWWLDLGAGGNETLTGNPVKLVAAAEVNGITVEAPNASTAAPYTLADGETFLAGPFRAIDFGLSEIAPQSLGFDRTRMVVNPGEKIPRAGQVGNQAPASRKTQATADTSNVAGTGVIPGANNQNVGGGCMIVGKTTVPELAILGIGDSIFEGNSDTQQILVGQGYADRAANDVGGKKVPFAHMGRHGGTLLRLTLTGQTRRIALAKYATHVFIALGANDLFTSADYINNFQSRFRTVVAALKAVNPSIKIHAITVAPRTQSIDKYTTVAGQIDQGSWDSATIKTGVNDWLKSLVTDGTIAGVFDINQAWATGGGNATWLTNGTDYYGFPGTNPDGTGSVTIVGTGTLVSATNSTTVTGTGTAFTTEATVGKFLYIGTGSGAQYIGRVASVQSATQLTLEANAVTARNGTFNVADRQNGTHPGPSLNILAGQALATYISNLAA